VHAPVGTQAPAQRQGAEIGHDLVTFMLLCVPEPVCHTDKGNCLSNSPAAMRVAHDHRPCLGGVQQTELDVDLGGGALDLRQRMHDRQWHALLVDGEEAKKRRLRSICAPHRHHPAHRWVRSFRFPSAARAVASSHREAFERGSGKLDG